MTVKLGMRVFWNHGPMPVTTRKTARLAMTVPFGVVMNLGGNGGSGGAVDSVNGKTGIVTLGAVDVGADVAGSAQAVSEALQPQVIANAQAIATKASTTALNEVRGLAELNEQKIGTKADQVDLEALKATVLTKADQEQLEWLIQLVNTMASQDYVIGKINDLLGGVSGAYDTLKEIADKLQLDDNQFAAILDALGNRVRFDAPQTLTSAEQQQARDNINAEAKGVAATLVGAITPASIGAATAAQGTKANTALQSGDVAPAALSGSFWDLVNKTKIFDVGFAAYAVGTNTALAVGDTLGIMLGKAQGQINALWTALADKADAASTAALLNQKVSSVLLGAAGGVATLGSDGILTAAQRPAASGGTDDKITWTAVTTILTAGVASGFADNSHPLMMGKDKNGVIYVKGAYRNTSSLNAVSSGTSSFLQLFTLPATHQVKGFAPTSTTYTIYAARYQDQNNAGTPSSTNYFCRLQVYQGVQTFGVSTSMGVDVICYIPPQAIGAALNP